MRTPSIPNSVNDIHLLDTVSFQSPEVLYCSKFGLQSGRWNLTPHTHDNLEMIYFLDGGARILGRNQVVEVSAEEIVLYPENIEHQEILDMSLKQEIVVLGAKLPKYSGIPNILKVNDSNGRLRWLFLEMFRNTQETFIGQQQIMAHLLHLVLFYFTQESRKGLRESRNPIDFSVDYINENYSSNIRIDDLLALADVSRSYFNRSFKKRMGRTPIGYLNHIRMESAKQLLVAEPSLSIAAIGERVGVNGEKYFSRLFKEQIGVAPTEFKRISGLKRRS